MNACWLSLTITPFYLDKLATNQEINPRALLKIIFQIMKIWENLHLGKMTGYTVCLYACDVESPGLTNT